MQRFLLLMMLWSAVGFAQNRQKLLNELDIAIEKRQEYTENKQKEINRALGDYYSAKTDSDRYNTLRTLYEKYRSFKIDSALIIADKRLEAAKRMGRPSKIVSASLNLAEGYVKSGNPDRAIIILDTIKDKDLESYQLKYKNSIYRNALALKASSTTTEEEKKKALEKSRELRQKAFEAADKDSRAYYTIYAENLKDAGLTKDAVAVMEEADKRFDFSQDAAMLYTMGELYRENGEIDKAIDCLAQSALLDIKSGTKEYRSLIQLASLLYNQGDIERSFDYINAAFEDIHFSKANMRNQEVMDIMPLIDKGFHDYEADTSRKIKVLLIVASALVLALLISIFLIIRNLMEKRKMVGTIQKINEDLEKKNETIKRADSLKLENINTLIKAYSSYISRLKDFRKVILRLIKTRQFEKVEDAVKSTKNESKDISTFMELFDETFLSIYPDFISEVNLYMKDPIGKKENGAMTPELRLIALMKLGMDSTDEISSILHYTPQTIYNLRNSIRNMINIDWDDFREKISHSEDKNNL